MGSRNARAVSCMASVCQRRLGSNPGLTRGRQLVSFRFEIIFCARAKPEPKQQTDFIDAHPSEPLHRHWGSRIIILNDRGKVDLNPTTTIQCKVKKHVTVLGVYFIQYGRKNHMHFIFNGAPYIGDIYFHIIHVSVDEVIASPSTRHLSYNTVLPMIVI